MKNTKSQMRQLRDKEFLEAYRKVAAEMLQSKRPFVRREAIKRAIWSGRPLYYLSYNRTYTVMLHYMAHGDVPLKAREQRAMWLEIASVVTDQLQKSPYLSLPQAIARTLATAHASRFFIGEAYAYKLLYRIMRERKSAIRA